MSDYEGKYCGCMGLKIDKFIVTDKSYNTCVLLVW